MGDVAVIAGEQQKSENARWQILRANLAQAVGCEMLFQTGCDPCVQWQSQCSEGHLVSSPEQELQVWINDLVSTSS